MILNGFCNLFISDEVKQFLFLYENLIFLYATIFIHSHLSKIRIFKFSQIFPPPPLFLKLFFYLRILSILPVDILKVLLLVSRELSNPEGLAEDQRDQMYCLLIEHAKRLVQTKYGRKFIYGKHILFSKLGL